MRIFQSKVIALDKESRCNEFEFKVDYIYIYIYIRVSHTFLPLVSCEIFILLTDSNHLLRREFFPTRGTINNSLEHGVRCRVRGVGGWRCKKYSHPAATVFILRKTCGLARWRWKTTDRQFAYSGRFSAMTAFDWSSWLQYLVELMASPLWMVLVGDYIFRFPRNAQKSSLRMKSRLRDKRRFIFSSRTSAFFTMQIFWRKIRFPFPADKSLQKTNFTRWRCKSHVKARHS